MPQKKRRQPLVLQTFTNDPDMIEKLRRLSHKKNVSVSSIIRDALQSYFANQLTADPVPRTPVNRRTQRTQRKT